MSDTIHLFSAEYTLLKNGYNNWKIRHFETPIKNVDISLTPSLKIINDNVIISCADNFEEAGNLLVDYLKEMKKKYETKYNYGIMKTESAINEIKFKHSILHGDILIDMIGGKFFV